MNTSRQANKKATNENLHNENSDSEKDFFEIEELTQNEKEVMQQPLPVIAGTLSDEELSDDAFLEQVFTGMDKLPLKELTSNYIDFKDFIHGEVRNYIFTGMDIFTTKDGEVKPAVKLMDKERTNFLCASTIVVNSLQKLEAVPAPVRIQVNGKIKSAKGEYYSVRVFTI